jgi:hypothetical protein
MSDRLENLRLFFPAEVTASYLAIQKLLAANGVGPTENMYFMIWIAVALAAVNAAVYWKLYEVSGVLWIAVITVGFLIWVLNIDMARFKDLGIINNYINIEIAAPAMLIFYTLITSFFQMPKRKPDA